MQGDGKNIKPKQKDKYEISSGFQLTVSKRGKKAVSKETLDSLLDKVVD